MENERRNDREPAATESSPNSSGIEGLEQLIDRLQCIDGDRDPVEIKDVLEQIGRRSFGPTVLLAGLVVLLPLIGDIPGVPTLAAVLVATTALQLLAGRQFLWLPDFLLKRSIARARLEKALNLARSPARFTDHFIRRRMEFFTGPTVTRVIGVAALGVALVMPLLELIPFSANLAGIALCAFGISLIARDGLFALFSMIVTGGTLVIVGYWLAGL